MAQGDHMQRRGARDELGDRRAGTSAPQGEDTRMTTVDNRDLENRDLAQRLARADSDQTTPEEAIALFDEARGGCPVVYSQERGGYYLLMGYHDVKAAHSNWQQLSTEPSIMRPLSEKPP